MGKQRRTDAWLALGLEPQDPDLWAMLGGFLATRDGHAAYWHDVPPLLQPLLWSSREALAARHFWHARELLPVFYRTGWGWRLRTDWVTRIQQMRQDDMHAPMNHTGRVTGPDTSVGPEDFPF